MPRNKRRNPDATLTRMPGMQQDGRPFASGPPGPAGPAGPPGAFALGFWDYSSTLTAPPTSNQVRFDAAHPYTTATRVWIRTTTTGGADAGAVLRLLAVGSVLYVQDKNDATLWAKFRTTADPVDLATYVEFAVAWVANGGALLNNQNVAVLAGWPASSIGAGTGDVVGPGAAVDTDVVVFDGTTGKLVKDSGVLVTDLVVTTDPRLTDARTPTAHAASHAAAGSDPVTLTESQITNLVTDLAGKVPTARLVSAGTGLTGGGDLSADRTLTVAYGTTAGTAAQGNDPRLADARAPTAHAPTHQAAGTDPLSVLLLGGYTGDPTMFLRADATFAVPPAGGLTQAQVLARVSLRG